MKPRLNLLAELLPLFLVILAFTLGFIFYPEQLQRAAIGNAAKVGEEQYGPDWEMVFGMVQWGIPAGAAGMYVVLTAGALALIKVSDPLRDWNYVMRLLRRPETTDPSRKEDVRLKLLRWIYAFKVLIAVLVLFAQWRYYEGMMGTLGGASQAVLF